jgi:diguanylate cyclase (GGDEF)-like protein
VLVVASFSSLITFACLKGLYLNAINLFIISSLIITALYLGKKIAWLALVPAFLASTAAQFVFFPLRTLENYLLLAQNLIIIAFIGFFSGWLFPWLKYKLPVFEHFQVVDQATGIWNAKQIKELVYAELERKRRYDTQFSLIEIKLAGHKEEEKLKIKKDLLKKIGHILKNNIRLADQPGRIGNLTFWVILPETSSQNAQKAAQRLKELIAAQLPTSDKKSAYAIEVRELPADQDYLKPFLKDILNRDEKQL